MINEKDIIEIEKYLSLSIKNCKKEGYFDYSPSLWSDCLAHFLIANLASTEQVYVIIPIKDKTKPTLWHSGHFNIKSKKFDILYAQEFISIESKNKINLLKKISSLYHMIISMQIFYELVFLQMKWRFFMIQY